MTLEPWASGVETLRMRVALIGPTGLDRIDQLTATIRNDHFKRGEGHQQIMGGPTPEQVKNLVWGPYRFSPGIGPDNKGADQHGRAVVYDEPLPMGEELPYELEHTHPGSWMDTTNQADWLRHRGTVVRVSFQVEHKDYGTWYLPCEIDTASLPVTVYVPEPGVSQ